MFHLFIAFPYILTKHAPYSVCLSVCLSLSLFLSASMYVFLSFYLSVSLSIFISFSIGSNPLLSLSISLSVSLPVFLSFSIGSNPLLSLFYLLPLPPFCLPLITAVFPSVSLRHPSSYPEFVSSYLYIFSRSKTLIYVYILIMQSTKDIIMYTILQSNIICLFIFKAREIGLNRWI